MTETHVLVVCDGVEPPQSLRNQKWSRQLPVTSLGTSADLDLHVQNLSGTVLGTIDDRAADLVRIASYVYAADQAVSRGGQADVFGQQWRRHFTLCIPVSDRAYWEQDHVRSALATVLHFVTDDAWTFHFADAVPSLRQLQLDVDDRQILGIPDAVVLFSGGADSLCTAVEAVADDQSRPILVSHRPAPHLNARQIRLAGHLRQRLGQWDFPHLSFWIHRRGSEAADTSQRSRAFLFACIGAAVAAELGISRILLGDNGIVSLNLPFNAQLVGALASRSTHPKFLHLFNAFIGDLAPHPMTVLDPLGTRTRAEVLEVLKRAQCSELLAETNSCSRTRGRPAATPQCGYCSQCVDRRFGSIAAGLEDTDLAERYGIDIFISALPEGEARTVAESYVRFARRVHEARDEELFDLFPQLFDCIVPSAGAPDRVASELTAMLHRHAASVLDVTSRMVTRHSSDLATGTLPSSCLLRMVVGSTEQPPLADPAEEHVFRQEGQRWTVRFAGQTRHFNHSKGLRYLARLLEHPGRDFHALDLAQDRSPGDGPVDRAQLARWLPANLSGEGLSLAGPADDDVLDAKARRQYQARIRYLRKQRDEVPSPGAEQRLAAIDTEITELQRALRSATDVRGRARQFDSATDRSRKAVSSALHRSLKTIGEFHPHLHRHLKICVSIGTYCVYNPDSPTTWATR
jgi:7-cyano-7-deazaguanine synthase in queuosine biosynthesis